MLHRLALRVLPSLTLAVTDDAVRRRKRWVMFVPGLFAFACYRAAKYGLPLAEPIALLLLSGAISMVTALCAYRVGRAEPFSRLPAVDGARRMAWVPGWIGGIYGMQLSLLVLALLWLVGYDYALHPDGPAMMALIIPSTSVARDAFEIGHVRRLEAMGRPFVTFPDGAALRAWLQQPTGRLMGWVGAGALTTIGAAWVALSSVSGAWAVPAQGAVVTLTAGTAALCAYFAGRSQGPEWVGRLTATPIGELLKFWWWPGLAFAATYDLVAVGFVLYVVKQAVPSVGAATAIAGTVGGLMTLYGYYLGHRREVESREQADVPSALLRCPFVMGILGKSREAMAGMTLSESAAGFEKTGRKVPS